MAMSKRARMEVKLKKKEESERKIFFHVTYHPQSPSAREIQQLFDEHVLHPHHGLPFNELSPNGSDISLDAMVVAYHRSPNLENILSYRKLHSRYGPPLSSLLEK